jgi:hypothetical protein
MTEEAPISGAGWWLRPAELPAFVYDPRVHSRRYVLAYLERAGASPMEAEDVLRQAEALEQRALALGYDLATAEHGTELLESQSPPFTPPGPGAETERV